MLFQPSETNRFSTTSNLQRHTLIGELGALGRLNRHTVGYEFVSSIPIGRSADLCCHALMERGDGFAVSLAGAPGHYSVSNHPQFCDIAYLAAELGMVRSEKTGNIYRGRTKGAAVLSAACERGP